MLTICFIATLLFGGMPPQDYYSLNAEDFFALPEVNEAINPNDLNRELLNAAIFHASNQARLSDGKPLFTHATKLEAAATKHSENMRARNFFSHLNKSQPELKTPMKRILREDSAYKATSENLARKNILQLNENNRFFINKEGNAVAQDSSPLPAKTYKELAQGVVNGWMHSSGHRKNLLGPYSYLGCGSSEVFYQKKGLPEVLITQNFGRK